MASWPVALLHQFLQLSLPVKRSQYRLITCAFLKSLLMNVFWTTPYLRLRLLILRYSSTFIVRSERIAIQMKFSAGWEGKIDHLLLTLYTPHYVFPHYVCKVFLSKFELTLRELISKLLKKVNVLLRSIVSFLFVFDAYNKNFFIGKWAKALNPRVTLWLVFYSSEKDGTDLTEH